MSDTEVKQFSLTFEGVVEAAVEDGGCARISENILGSDPEMFVRLQSWSDDKRHPMMDFFEGKRVRVTVEVLP